MTSNIVIIGASYSGLPAAHYLLKHAPESWKITLINPSTNFYFNVASPRAGVEQSILGKNNGDLFIPFLPKLEKHGSRFAFLHGKASAVDTKSQTVTVTLQGGKGETSVTYDHLIIASGANTSGATGKEWGFKHGLEGNTEEILVNTRAAVKAAKKIVVSGAGATGVEFAGEIKDFYGAEKEVLVISATKELLPQVPRADVGASARKILKKIGVKIKTGVRVVEERPAAKGVEGAVELVLSNGDVISADLHIATWGIYPNTSFLPKDLLDNAGWVKMDEYMRAEGTQNIWAIGDVTHWGNRKLTTVDGQWTVAVQNIVSSINGGGVEVFKKYVHSDSLMIVVPMGRKFPNAVVFISGWKLWGAIGWFLKGRTYMIEGARPVAEGITTPGRVKI
ncbi:FAD/NAD(P)-binding domain-containing protein [Choiromyces venosus 120613-1]|uniref:FAD/NAD(P)-binding domain-containing protein n=1 Tax=Choiromyces venosus 120613-1 TaxID=1336337 RepID=A0A3N4JLE7_9PEZI|nr:FAD/NAD(P)-binding domain-containing protein [Choiromyces venosus 120613-1]